MLAYSLNKNISVEKIFSDINKMIENFRQQDDTTDILLVIDIKAVTQDNNSLIPKLEYKPQ